VEIEFKRIVWGFEKRKEKKRWDKNNANVGVTDMGGGSSLSAGSFFFQQGA